jgi:hypothetical protein
MRRGGGGGGFGGFGGSMWQPFPVIAAPGGGALEERCPTHGLFMPDVEVK